jgi:proline iminopeptidase
MRELYPLFETYNTGFLDVGSGHQIYFEESGNPNGIPVVYVNGGPGGFSKPKHRQYFNPTKYRVIAYNQRGCNNSKFKQLLKDNTTKELVEDIEKLRKHLNINKWIMCGRSWGSTLVLAYALKYPFNIKAIITGGIFLARDLDEEFVYQFGANQIFPESYHRFINYFDLHENDGIYKVLKESVYQNNLEKAFESTMEIFRYEGSISLLIQEPEENIEQITDVYKERIVNSGKIFLHYLQNKFFISENEFFENVSPLKTIPGVIIQGRYDLVCPYINAWTLHNEWPEAEFITTIAGHNGGDKENLEKILEYTDKFAEIV